MSLKSKCSVILALVFLLVPLSEAAGEKQPYKYPERKHFFCEFNADIVYILASNKPNFTRKKMRKSMTSFVQAQKLTETDLKYLLYLVDFVYYHEGTIINITNMFRQNCYSDINKFYIQKEKENTNG